MTGITTVPARLAGRSAVVTGASSGNGRAIALALAAEGAAVVCADLQPSARPGGYETRPDVDTDALIREQGGEAVFQRTDVTKEADHAALAARAVAEFGRLDVWVNNAGIGVGYGEIDTATVDDLATTLAVNLQGMWLGCQAAVRQMRTQEIVGRGRGRIVNLGSLSGLIGQAFNTIYASSKGGVHQLTKALAVEVGPHGITVNAIAPGYFPTAMTRQFWDDAAALDELTRTQPWFELPVTEDVAGPVVFLASDEAAFVTGHVLVVDGGASVA